MKITNYASDFSATGLGNTNRALDYIAAASITDVAKQNKLKALYTALNSAGIWSKLEVIRLLNNLTLTASALNFKNPSLYVANIDNTSPAKFTANGYDFNVGAAYIGNYPINDANGDLLNFHMHAYNFNAETATNTSASFMGLFIGTNIELSLRRKPVTSTYIRQKLTLAGADLTKTGLLSGAKVGSALKLYDAGALKMTSNITDAATTISGNIWEGAFGTTAAWKTLTTIPFIAYGKGAWTDADELALYNAVTAYLA